ncbi:hypothetical protein KCU60_g20711, partial [Aureobasidium melanogenum]
MEATTFPDSFAQINDLPRQHKYGVTYRQDALGDFHLTAQNLNSALGQLFEKKKSGQLAYEELVAKVAYNLYISSAPPDLDCWNTLLCGFMDCGDIFLVNPTLNAIRNANVRHNEITIRATLKYYIMVNSPDRFVTFVDRVRGLGNGLMLAKPTITINDSGRHRLVLKDNGKIVQKPYHTPGVFETIVQGVLHFAGFDVALRICKDMRREGWGLSIRGLTPLLDDRARNADYKLGCQIWGLIKMLQAESKAKGNQERLFARTYSAMLRLCSACNDMARFDEILREARAAKYEHKDLLRMFRQEMLEGSSAVRHLKEPKSGIQHYVQEVALEDFQHIEEKEPERIDEDILMLPEAQAVMSSASIDSSSGLAFQEDDDWLDSPMVVRS